MASDETTGLLTAFRDAVERGLAHAVWPGATAGDVQSVRDAIIARAEGVITTARAEGVREALTAAERARADFAIDGRAFHHATYIIDAIKEVERTGTAYPEFSTGKDRQETTANTTRAEMINVAIHRALNTFRQIRDQVGPPPTPRSEIPTQSTMNQKAPIWLHGMTGTPSRREVIARAIADAQAPGMNWAAWPTEMVIEFYRIADAAILAIKEYQTQIDTNGQSANYIR